MIKTLNVILNTADVMTKFKFLGMKLKRCPLLYIQAKPKLRSYTTIAFKINYCNVAIHASKIGFSVRP